MRLVYTPCECWYSDGKPPYCERSPKVPPRCFRKIINNPKHSVKIAIPILNTLYHFWAISAPPRGQNCYFGLKQPSWETILHILKWLKTHSKVVTPKTKVHFNCSGRDWTLKSGLRIFIWSPQVPFFVPKSGQFWQKVPILASQKWHSGCTNENS